MTTPRELVYFALLGREQHANAIRRLAVTGMNVATISAATTLAPAQIRMVLAEVRV